MRLYFSKPFSHQICTINVFNKPICFQTVYDTLFKMTTYEDRMNHTESELHIVNSLNQHLRILF